MSPDKRLSRGDMLVTTHTIEVFPDLITANASGRYQIPRETIVLVVGDLNDPLGVDEYLCLTGGVLVGIDRDDLVDNSEPV